MENGLSSRVLVVTSPTQLTGVDHASSIDGLCQRHALVILMRFGDERYELPGNYCLPHNAKTLSYDYESLDSALAVLEGYLRQFGIDLISRHHINGSSLPFLFGGAILQVPSDVRLSFFDKHTPRDVVKTTVSVADAEWDL